MKTTVFNVIKKAVPYLLGLIAGLYFVVLVTGSIIGLSKYKLDFPQYFSEWFKNIATHPIQNYLTYIGDKNPVAIVLSTVVILYLTYFALKRNQRNKEWKTADTDTHGSATWGNIKDLLSQYFSITPKTLRENFISGLDQDKLEQLKEKGAE